MQKKQRTFYSDNDKEFHEGERISFVLKYTGEKYEGRIVKIKTHSIYIDNISVDDMPAPSQEQKLKIKMEDIKNWSCEHV